jgi:hypothetical protein
LTGRMARLVERRRPPKDSLTAMADRAYFPAQDISP